jgi:hypothetical protein
VRAATRAASPSRNGALAVRPTTARGALTASEQIQREEVPPKGSQRRTGHREEVAGTPASKSAGVLEVVAVGVVSVTATDGASVRAGAARGSPSGIGPKSRTAPASAPRGRGSRGGAGRGRPRRRGDRGRSLPGRSEARPRARREDDGLLRPDPEEQVPGIETLQLGGRAARPSRNAIVSADSVREGELALVETPRKSSRTPASVARQAPFAPVLDATALAARGREPPGRGSARLAQRPGRPRSCGVCVVAKAVVAPSHDVGRVPQVGGSVARGFPPRCRRRRGLRSRPLAPDRSDSCTSSTARAVRAVRLDERVDVVAVDRPRAPRPALAAHRPVTAQLAPVDRGGRAAALARFAAISRQGSDSHEGSVAAGEPRPMRAAASSRWRCASADPRRRDSQPRWRRAAPEARGDMLFSPSSRLGRRITAPRGSRHRPAGRRHPEPQSRSKGGPGSAGPPRAARLAGTAPRRAGQGSRAGPCARRRLQDRRDRPLAPHARGRRAERGVGLKRPPGRKLPRRGVARVEQPDRSGRGLDHGTSSGGRGAGPRL